MMKNEVNDVEGKQKRKRKSGKSKSGKETRQQMTLAGINIWFNNLMAVNRNKFNKHNNTDAW